MSGEWPGPPSFDNPAIRELSEYPNWVCWKIVEVEVKGETLLKKVPINPGTGGNAMVSRPETWGTFAQACERWVNDSAALSGIGFVWSAKLPYIGVDLDKCRDPIDGKINEKATDYIKRLNSYTEISPSGGGLHVLVRGKLTHKRRRIGHLEIYSDGRFFTVTGEHLEGTPTGINEAGSVLDKLLSTAFQQSQAATGRDVSDDHVLRDRDTAVLEAEIAAVCDPDAEPSFEAFDVLCANSTIVRHTWDHTRKDAKEWSLSEYDLALANFFLSAKWSNREITKGLIAHRRRWGGDKLDRADYYARTILTAHRNRGKEDAQESISETALDGKDRKDLRKTTLGALSEIYGEDFLDIRKFISDPPTYEIQTAKGIIGPDDIDLLFSQTKFRKHAAAALDAMFPKCKEKEWEERVKAMLAIVREKSLGADATYEGQMTTWVRDYIMESPGELREQDADVIMAGQPFLKEGRVVIIAERFSEWLQRSKGQKLPPQKRGYMLKAMGAVSMRVNFKHEDGKRSSANCWIMPKGFDDEPDQDE